MSHVTFTRQGEEVNYRSTLSLMIFLKGIFNVMCCTRLLSIYFRYLIFVIYHLKTSTDLTLY